MTNDEVIDAEFEDLANKAAEQIEAEEKKKEQEKPQEQLNKNQNMMVAFNPEGLVEFTNHGELAAAAKLLLQMKLVPKHLKEEGVEAIMTAITTCKQYNLPYSAMNEMGYVEGKLGFFGSLVTAIAQRDPKYGEVVTLFVDREYNEISLKNKNLHTDVYAAVMRLKNKDSEIWKEFYFTMDEAEKSGLIIKKSGKSTNYVNGYRKDMLYHKVKNRAYNTEFAGVLKGINSFEMMVLDYQHREDSNPARDLNKKLGLDVDENIDT